MKYRNYFIITFILFVAGFVLAIPLKAPAATLTFTAPPSIKPEGKMTAQLGFADAIGVKSLSLVLNFSSGSILSANLAGFKRNVAFIPTTSTIGGVPVNFEEQFKDSFGIDIRKIFIVGLSPASAPGQVSLGSILFTASKAAVSDTQVVTLSGQVYTDTGLVQDLVPVSQLITVTALTDTDHDGMDDNWETYYFGNLSRDGNADFNHNGISDKVEYLNGTDPKASDFSVIAGGDINGNGVVDLEDAILVFEIMSGRTPAVSIFNTADINQDGKIGMQEAIYILQKIAQLRD
jgi:hypothetical protein